MAGIPYLSLQYIGVPVRAALLTGAPYDPTSDTVRMAFMPQVTQVPQPADWQQAIWAAQPASVIYPYAAYCLVGPGGTITLGIGRYVIWLKVTDNPEIPVLTAGYL